MKKTILIAIAISLFHNFTCSQWFQQNSGTTGDLKSVYFVNPLTGWVCGVTGSQSTDRIAKTTDGGTTWVKQNAGTFYVLNTIQFINDQTGWAAGIHGTVVKTTNGGANWFLVFGTTNWDWFDIQFIDTQTGWVAGFTDAIFRTTDGGMNWSGVNFNGSGTRSFFFINQNTGWLPISSFNGKVNKSTNGGLSWLELTQPSLGISDVFFIDLETGWISGSDLNANGIILKTIDGGVSWNSIVVDSPQSIRKFHFYNNYLGWAAGNSGKIYKTTNGGLNWSLQNSLTNNDLNTIFFVDSFVGWCVGLNGITLKTTNGGGTVGIHIVSTQGPTNFELFQNYPNPFNPITKIKFGIPQKNHVLLTVFDAIGKHISTLINEVVVAGEHEVEFDARTLPSGTYLYRFKSGSFIETKKMVLIK